MTRIQKPVTGGRARYYVVESDEGRQVPEPERVRAGDGRVLSRQRVGYPARVRVEDHSGDALPRALLIRVAAAAGHVLAERGDGEHRPLEIHLGPAGTPPRVEASGALERLTLDGPALAAMASRHPVRAQLDQLLDSPVLPVPRTLDVPTLGPVENRALFFESLMSAVEEHNDRELSQGVLHLVSSLATTPTEVVFASVKMPLRGQEGPLSGLGSVKEALASGPVHLVCLTLLEDYFEGARALIDELRNRGCRAHVAVGGVMPSLSPEHVAAHLPEVTFVCRGDGETFLPTLAKVVGRGDVDTPFDDAQCQTLMAMDGLLAVDRAGRQLLAGNPGRLARVTSLDAVSLDLAHVQPRHLEGGIEISTARGCSHRCTFCSILGRQDFRARSAPAILGLLAQYDARFRELYGEAIPPQAYRVHISDDDFGCDPDRAATFLRSLIQTPFRLSSLQLSVADLCRKSGRRPMPDVDPTLLSALDPRCFADAAHAAPDDQIVNDRAPRRWSSYLHLGVESFCDRELGRLGKGYRVAHIRAVVQALSARRLHLDAYFILSNAATTGDDFVDSLLELCRLKLRYPVYFHLRFPVVKHLVSYFPSDSHRRLVRRGHTDSLKLRRVASHPGYPELDYPFVEHDVPQDPWARPAAAADVLRTKRRYTDSLVQLRTLWQPRYDSLPDGEEKRAGERLLRRLDDAPRRLVFEYLREAHVTSRDGGTRPDLPDGRTAEAIALAAAREVLGPSKDWIRTYQRFEREEVPRLVVIPTWQCQLRCRYCYVAKQDGRVMTTRTLERAVDLLLGSRRKSVMLQFFGAEPLMEYGLVQHGIEYGTQRAREEDTNLSFVLSSNGWGLDAERLQWLSGYPVKLELSLDGEAHSQNLNRRAADRGADSYERSIASRAEDIVTSGLDHEVIMVVHPSNVRRLPDNFFHIVSLGFARLQINFTLGVQWQREEMESFAEGLHTIGIRLRERWAAGESLRLVNLENRPLNMRLNGEVTVDHDGTIYAGNGFLHETEHKARFAVSHLDACTGFDRHWLDTPDNDFLLRWTYLPDITANNLEVGRIMNSFIRWMRQEPLGPP